MSGTLDAEKNAAVVRRLVAERRWVEAESLLRDLLAQSPDDLDVLMSLGSVLVEQLQFEEAERVLLRAAELKPTSRTIHSRLASLYRQQNRVTDAIAQYELILQHHPRHVSALNNLANLYKSADFAKAIPLYERALTIEPNRAEIISNLAIALQGVGRLSDAAQYLTAYLKLKPDDAGAWNNLGHINRELGRIADAAAAFQQSLKLDRKSPDAWSNYGILLQHNGRLAEAQDCFNNALHLQPNHPEALNNLAGQYRQQARIEEAYQCYKRAGEQRDDFAGADSNAVFTLHYRPGITESDLLDAHRAWSTKHTAKITRDVHPPLTARDPNKTLRVGLISADMGQHPVGYLLVRGLENLDRRGIELIAYSDRARNDSISQRIAAVTCAWRDILGRSDDDVATMIRNDNLDILIELAGHTAHNRLLVLARKPAPVQVSWLGYEGTTGVDAIDYLFADVWTIPHGREQYFSETVVRLPSGYVCYDPPTQSAAVGPLPAALNGYITFGSFNNPAKLNADVVRVWSQLLQRVPTAKLVLKYRGNTDPIIRDALLTKFAKHGIGVDRVELADWSAYADFLGWYNRVDIALDPWPFNGGITTCEALWHGVPVVSLAGDTFAGRHGVTYLNMAGCSDWIATNETEYIEKATALANSIGELSMIRGGLREQVSKSRLCNGAAFAADLAAALRSIWRGTANVISAPNITSNAASTVAANIISNENQQRFAQAEELRFANKLPEAEAAYRAIVNEIPTHAESWRSLGLVLKSARRPDEALAAFRHAVEVRPSYAEARNNIANIHLDRGEHAEAETQLLAALDAKPDYTPAMNTLGNLYRGQKKLQDAKDIFARALKLRPDYAAAHVNLAAACHELGQLDEAAKHYREALKIDPTMVAALQNLAAVEQQLGNTDAGLAPLRQLVQQNPNSAEHHRSLGVALRQAGRLNEALTVLIHADKLDPHSCDTLNLLGNTLRGLGRHADAAKAYERALLIDPNLAATHNNYAGALRDLGRTADAFKHFAKAVELKPDYAEAHNNWGVSLHDAGQIAEAEQHYARALELKPDYGGACNNLGGIYRDRCEIDRAMELYRRAADIRSNYAEGFSNYCFTMHYRPRVTAQQLLEAHEEWATRYTPKLQRFAHPPLESRDRNKKLRIGFVSADLGQHPVGYLLRRGLEHLDQSKCEIVCYSDRVERDPVGDAIAKHVSKWVTIAGRNDDEVTQLIRDDQIDVLVDLAGHTAHNRLLVFARKPAPVQMTWLGYEGTTGVREIDYLIADRWVMPKGADAEAVETVLRLPSGYVVYNPPTQAVDVEVLPAARSGAITFGCFNNPAKLNADVLAVWCEILNRVPDSRLILKYRGLDDPTVTRGFREEIRKHGIADSRVIFSGWSAYHDFLTWYNRVDIALDPWPFNGGITTCEALWHGVPVVSLAGNTFAGRHGVAYLNMAGCSDWIAATADKYIEKAVSLAQNIPALAKVRAELRDKVRASRLCDGSALARDLVLAFQHAWRGGAAGTVGELERLLARAEQFHRQRQLPEAVAAFRAALAIDPTSADAHRGLGLMLKQLNDREGAKAALTEAVRLRPNFAEAWNNLGNMAMEENNTAEGEQCFRKAIQAKPTYSLALNNLANVCREQNQLEQAIGYYRRAVASDPTLTPAHNNLALTYWQLNRFDEAEASYRDALKSKPDDTTAARGLSLALQTSGKFDVATALYEQALKTQPTPELMNNYANLLRQQNRRERAIELYEQAIKLKPDFAEAHNNYGVTLQELDRIPEAEASYKRALEARGGYPEALNNYASLLKIQKRFSEAEACFREAVARNPNYAAAHCNLGAILQNQKQYAAGNDCILTAIKLEPDNPDVYYNHGNLLAEWGKFDDAIRAFNKALELKPNYAEVMNNLGNTLKEMGQTNVGGEWFQKAIAIKPDYVAAHNNMGLVHQDQGRLTNAEQCFRRAIELQADYAPAYNNLGGVLREQAKIPEAIASYERSWELRPDSMKASSNVVFALHYKPGVTPQELRAAHELWAYRHTDSITPLSHGPRDPNKKLRIGLISPDLGHHPVGFLLVRGMEALSRDECELVCYSDRSRKDAVAERISKASTLWRFIHGMPDAELIERIRKDEIDVLIELAGHTARNRLTVMAKKPAPLQATWIGYEGTTGVKQIDYLIADPWLIRSGDEQYSVEKVLRLPSGYVSYDPPRESAAVGPLPMLKNRFVTFGSFNNSAKLNDDVIRVWCEILKRIPNSRLLLKYRSMGDPPVRQLFHDRFQANGISADRVEISGWSSYADFLQLYNRVDIALDPWPFNGGITTCEALWHGVPVVSLAGNTFAGRHGVTYLNMAGCSDWLANSEREYVERAVQRAGDATALATTRANLREQVRASRLCDGAALARDWLAAIRGAWRG